VRRPREQVNQPTKTERTIAAIGKEYAKATLASANEIERDRMKKTAKLFVDLVMRLFEDAAVTLKILEANEAAGIGEQAVFDLREAEPEQTQEPPTPETAEPTDAGGKGKKGGAK